MAMHKCPINGCPRKVPQHLLMCATHWRLVPKDLQREVYSAFDDGLGAGTEEHVHACRRAIDAVNESEGAKRHAPQL